MNEYVWLFPVIFMFHEMEEICGFGIWLNKNMSMLEKRFPFIAKEYSNYSNEGFAAAVFEELILLLIICIISRCTDFYCLWLGGLIAFTFHLVVHIIQSVVIRKYIPALVTSILALPLSLLLIINSIKIIGLPTNFIIAFSIVGIVIVFVNLKIAHMLMKRYQAFFRK